MTMLTTDQTAALDNLNRFLTTPARDFLLEGGAGTGKTWLVGHFLQTNDLRGRRWVACAFTNKATNVLRSKLEAAGVPWSDTKAKQVLPGVVMTGTTSQLLGVGPTDDGGESKGRGRNFKKLMAGLFEKYMPDVVIIDEVSMLSDEHLAALRDLSKADGCKILAVGDRAQLPPVNAKPIDFTSFAERAELRQIVRQAEDSAIIQLGWAIRDDKPWGDITGPGIRHSDDIVRDYLAVASVPTQAQNERDRSVFVAYTNKRVDSVQEQACQKLYGHGHGTVAKGEVVVAEAPYQRFCTNQDEMMVLEVRMNAATLPVPDALRHSFQDVPVHAMKVQREVLLPPMFGAKDPKPIRDTLTCDAVFLTKEERQNKYHNFNVIAEHLRQVALAAGAKGPSAEFDRKKAWGAYYRWLESLLVFRHPFAFTSHKSQGSTYRQVFVDTDELSSFSRESLYVAVTRAAEEVVIPKPVAVFRW